MRVSVVYAPDPWYRVLWTWVTPKASRPSRHFPTREQTIEAAEILRAADRAGRPVNFGYMGSSGLMPSDVPCTFRSKGLELLDQDDAKLVLSYFNPI